MIYCPNCKEEIDDDSRFCDQCGQALLFCNKCGRVGLGRRCTNCGGMMLSAEEYFNSVSQRNSISSSFSLGYVSRDFATTGSTSTRGVNPSMGGSQGIPLLLLYNDALNIRIQGVNGAVIGRRQGPYVAYFQNNMYVSGVHAQLKYNVGGGWSIIDKHSSNGTKLNEHPIQPDVEMSLRNGDIVTIANINFQVSVS